MEIKVSIDLASLSMDDGDVREMVMQAIKSHIWVEVSKVCKADYGMRESMERIVSKVDKLKEAEVRGIEHLLNEIIEIVRKPNENKQIPG